MPLDGVAVKIGADGRVRLGGPVLFDGYDGRPGPHRAGAWSDGWFVTQDLGRIDHDGLLRVHGRVDDVVITGGVKVPAGGGRGRLREHPAVREAEVVGVPDPSGASAVVAVVVAGDLALDAARDWVAADAAARLGAAPRRTRRRAAAAGQRQGRPARRSREARPLARA